MTACSFTDSWPVGSNVEDGEIGCLPLDGVMANAPRLAGLPEGGFALAFDTAGQAQGGQIYFTTYSSGNWQASPTLAGDGFAPEIQADTTGQLHLAWCGAAGQLHYQKQGGQVETFDFPACLDRPGLAIDSNGAPHVVWYANQVETTTDQLVENSLLYESIRQESGWSAPAIVSQTGQPSQVALTNDQAGTLHLAWNDNQGETSTIHYTSQVQYACLEEPASPAARAVLAVVDNERYHPPDETIPYCHNQYDEFVMSPNPSPPLVEDGAVPTQNGPFDEIALMVEDAQYEVLFAVMFYDGGDYNDNPGSVMAQGIAKLYRQLKENPEQFPRGITVRILLGNPPEVANFQLGNQVWQVIKDLRNAGVPEMTNESLGWKVEVADFGGAWPHSHTKFVVVDGKHAAGFWV